jgi:hypothetical protein
MVMDCRKGWRGIKERMVEKNEDACPRGSLRPCQQDINISRADLELPRAACALHYAKTSCFTGLINWIWRNRQHGIIGVWKEDVVHPKNITAEEVSCQGKALFDVGK